ncbi:MAG: sulfite exporter TauE/SafE family protein [Oscillospiraceae bacterium]|nr:sulfite exporter TauE/SafE family protein [Oscillospiraceae bacterium]MCI9363007.1 sulfite exporter TauE/SafE family protein [Oscillospiraceae bacterium]MCI9668377.1 sulfite exporter TauE/SafE family protein [Oscillospiraceae bacterium]
MIGTILAGIGSGLLGSLGMGAGAILLVYLRVFGGMEQMQAQGVNLLFFLPIAGLSLFLHSRKGLVQWKNGLLCAAAGIPMVFAGVWLAGYLGGVWLSKLFALLLVYIGVRELRMKEEKKNPSSPGQDSSPSR